MDCTRRIALGFYALLATAFAPAAVALADPTVWSGLTFEFVKPDDAFPFPTDQITETVALTRGQAGGMYNAVFDPGWNGSGPTGTLWATDINNSGETIAATNFDALTFDTWLDAYGGLFEAGRNVANRDAVVLLFGEILDEDDDIYLDLRFTQWTMGGNGGGFAYLRAEPPSTTPTGDYSNDGVVDAADYVVWRRTLNQPAIPSGSGADGNQNGTIDDGDYTHWRERFGNIVPGAGGGATAVPEPATGVLAFIGLLFLHSIALRQRCA